MSSIQQLLVSNNAPLPPVQITYIGFTDINPNQLSYSYPNVSIGGPGLIVFTVQGDVGGTSLAPTSALVNGVSATKVIEKSATGPSTTTTIGMFYSVILSGTTANFDITFSVAPGGCRLAVWRLTDYSNSSPNTFTSNSGVGDTGLSVSMNNVPSGAAVIVGSCTGDVKTHTFTVVSKRFDQSIAGRSTGSAGGDTTTSTSSTVTVTTSYTTSAQPNVLVMACWR